MNKILSKAFIFMFLGLLITFITGYVVSINENMIEAVYGGLYWVFIILELVLVIFFASRVYKMKPTSAKLCFLLYSFVSGLTFSSIFIFFKLSSIISVFLITALVFGVFGLLGYFTKLDLSKLGTFCLMALFATLICSIVNIFLNNSTFELILSIVVILIFLGYTAYDIKNLKTLAENGVDNEALAINSAFELYLDFINIFIHLLSILGNSKD